MTQAGTIYSSTQPWALRAAHRRRNRVLWCQAKYKEPPFWRVHVNQDNWIITPDPLGGVELHSADAVARFHRENRGVNNVHTLELVRSKYV